MENQTIDALISFLQETRQDGSYLAKEIMDKYGFSYVQGVASKDGAGKVNTYTLSKQYPSGKVEAIVEVRNHSLSESDTKVTIVKLIGDTNNTPLFEREIYPQNYVKENMRPLLKNGSGRLRTATKPYSKPNEQSTEKFMKNLLKRKGEE